MYRVVSQRNDLTERFARYFLICSAVIGAAVVSYSQEAGIVPGQERYRIGYQDRITVQVFNRPNLTQTVDVNSNGTISLFRLPEPVVAACKTEGELAAAIAAAL